MATPLSGDVLRLTGHQFFEDPNLPLSVRRVTRHGVMEEPHGHDFNELVIVVDGRATHRVGVESYEIEKGDAFVILGQMTHHYPAVRGLSLINILYDPGFLRDRREDIGEVPGFHALFEIEPMIRRTGRFRNRLRLDPEALAVVLQMIAEMEEELETKRPGYRAMSTANFERLVCYLSRYYTRSDPASARIVPRLGRVLSLIERRFAGSLSSEILSREAGMSVTNFNRRFREVTGYSPIDYLLRFRVSRAKHLLRTSELTVTDIGLEVGFCDGNYFARQFRRVTGESPRDFRRRARNASHAVSHT